MAFASRPITQDIGLFLIVALATNAAALAAVEPLHARQLMQLFYLLTFIHIGASLNDGFFDRRRTTTWVILMLGWLVAECTSFIGYAMPTGQLLFWLATNTPWAAPFLERLVSAPWTVPAVLLALLATDMVCAHLGHEPGRAWTRPALIAAAIATGLASDIVLPGLLPPPPPPSPLSFDILPSWHLLPFYALLRVAPDKTLGVSIAFLALAAPTFWPWLKPDVEGTRRSTWRMAWLAFVATFVSLFYLGAQPPDQGIVLMIRLAALYYFAFLLVLPLLWRRPAPHAS